jgi:hypothetical protein
MRVLSDGECAAKLAKLCEIEGFEDENVLLAAAMTTAIVRWPETPTTRQAQRPVLRADHYDLRFASTRWKGAAAGQRLKNHPSIPPSHYRHPTIRLPDGRTEVAPEHSTRFGL